MFYSNCVFFFLMIRRPPRSTRTDTSFPTRRSSDLSISSAPMRARNFSAHSGCHCDQAKADTSAEPEMRSEEHTSELQSLMRISYAVFCLKKKTKAKTIQQISQK